MNNDIRIKKRKRGRCSWCGEAIERGTPFCMWPSVDGDGVPNGSCTMHPECNQAYSQSGRETFTKFVFERGADNDLTTAKGLSDSSWDAVAEGADAEVGSKD